MPKSTFNVEFWEDVKAPATSLKKGSSAPADNTDYGWLEFAHNADNYVFHLFQIPHARKEDEDIGIHVHWMKTTSAAGEVEWQVEYRWIPIGETMAGSWTTDAELTPSVSDNDTAYSHAITAFNAISGTGIAISDMLLVKLTRLGSSYSGSNHYTAPAALLELDLHVAVDGWGSDEPFTKNY